MQFVITGTDTDVGKTVCAAMLTLGMKGLYWKPIQCGTEEGTDRQRLAEICGEESTLPEKYIFQAPLSPHRASELENISIDVNSLTIPNVPEDTALIIEGAGGLMVPITREFLFIDLFQTWNIPVILCARTALGTINHTLLSIEALKEWNIPIHGIIFVGDDNPDTIETIMQISGIKSLGRVPMMEEVDCERLKKVFESLYL